jgi:glutamate--cysteine ligase
MARDHDNSYVRFVLALSLAHRKALRGLPLPRAVEERLTRLARDSLAEQERIEAADRVPFEAYRRQYLSPELLGV